MMDTCGFLALSLSGGHGGRLGSPSHKERVQRVACPLSQGPVTGVIDDVFIIRCRRWVAGGGAALFYR